MPGTLYIDQARTYVTPPIALAAAVKTKFGTDEPDISRDGERKYVVSVAATYRTENGMPPQSEVLQVTVTGGTDPTSAIQPGMPVELADLRCGVSAPESRPDGRVRGGRLWYQASGVRPFTSNGSGRPVPAGARTE